MVVSPSLITHRIEAELELPLPLAEVFPFFSAAENLGKITPPELAFRIVTPPPIAMAVGTRIDYRISLFGLPMKWRTRITAWDPPYAFEDDQERGPYAQWLHRHAFEDIPGGTRILDRVTIRLPLSPLGDVAWPLVRLQLRRIFRYRQEAVARHFLGTTDDVRWSVRV